MTLRSSAVNSEVTDFSYHTSFALWESVLEPRCTDYFFEQVLSLLSCLHIAEGTAAAPGAGWLVSSALLQPPRVLTWPQSAVSGSFPLS